MSSRNHIPPKTAHRVDKKTRAAPHETAPKVSSLEHAHEARSRAEHEASFLRNEVDRLHNSVARLQERCEDYAMRLAMSHGGREELIHLRSRLFDTSHELEAPQAIPDILPSNVTDQLRLLVAERDDARMWLDAVRRSTSWRITRPFRVVIRLLKSRLHA